MPFKSASKLTMKSLLVLALLVFGFFSLVNNSGLAHRVELTKDIAVMPFRYGNLLAKAPEEKIQVPVRAVRSNRIADTWHAPRDRERLHQGQDIFAPRGTAVYSATEGYVLRVGQNSLGGNTISILGAGGRVYYYAHLDKYASDLAAGNFVSPETVIGYVGNTGNAKGTPPHLHFGVYTASGSINPLTLF